MTSREIGRKEKILDRLGTKVSTGGVFDLSEGTVVTYRAQARDGAGILGGTGLKTFSVGQPPDTTPPGVSILVFPEIPPTSDKEIADMVQTNCGEH